MSILSANGAAPAEEGDGEELEGIGEAGGMTRLDVPDEPMTETRVPRVVNASEWMDEGSIGNGQPGVSRKAEKESPQQESCAQAAQSFLAE